MAKKVKIIYEGKELEGEQLEFEGEKESWNKYTTEDGSIIKLKVVVSKIIRTNLYNPNGDPIYVVNSTNLVDADVPDKLKKTSKTNEDKIQ